MKTITLKLTKLSPNYGPFNVMDQFRNIIAENVSKTTLSSGISYYVDDNVTMITLVSLGRYKLEKTVSLKDITTQEYNDTKTINNASSCLWRHLTDVTKYNSYYGLTEDYIIEYPFAFSYLDELVQNIKDYTRVYKYLPSKFASDVNAKIELNDRWFSSVILYNSQQSTGILELVPKPLNNLMLYNSYPIYNENSKTIVYSKTDNFYNFNCFWALQKSAQIPLFLSSCSSLSIDKVINQDNMDYSTKQFKKATIRAKDLKVRYTLSESDIHLVSQFLVASTQKSYL